jgi:hypothetical protein
MNGEKSSHLSNLQSTLHKNSRQIDDVKNSAAESMRCIYIEATNKHKIIFKSLQSPDQVRKKENNLYSIKIYNNIYDLLVI